jgi:hypothetical protein
MRKSFILFLIFLISSSAFSQADSASYKQKLEDIKKHRLIYTTFTESYSTTNYSQGGVSKGSATSRSMSFDFKVGNEGQLQNIGRRGSNLKSILINDKAAYDELNRAYNVHLRKKRVCNALEIVGYVTLVASAVVLFVGGSNYESDGVTPPLVIGGIGVVLSLTDIVVFKKRTDKHMDNFANSVQQSIVIYNQNQLNKIK